MEATPATAKAGPKEVGTARRLKQARECADEAEWRAIAAECLRPGVIFHDQRYDMFMEVRKVEIVLRVVKSDGESATCVYTPGDNELRVAKKPIGVSNAPTIARGSNELQD